MMKSKYFHSMKIKDDVYAVFNSLILDIEYITSKDFDLINNEKYYKIDFEKLEKYIKKGIIVESEATDQKAYNILYKNYINDCRKLDFMYLIITQGCNLGCKYCFLENMDANWVNRRMDIKTARVAIDKYIQHIKKNKISEASIMLFGGEPLINWDLFKGIINYTRTTYPELFRKNAKNKLSFRTVTNGTLITKQKALYFKKNNIIPAISLDGPKHINDKNRIFKGGNKSVYDAVMDVIKILKENDCPFGLSITLSKEVVDEGQKIVDWLKDLDVKDIYFNPLHYNESNDEWKVHYEKSTKFIINSFFELLRNDIVNGRPVRQISSFVKRSFYYADCGSAGLHQIAVKPDGEVLVCQCDYTSEKNKLGNILEDDIETMINSANTERWIKSIPLLKKECQNCESIFICGGSCLTQNANMFDHSCMVDQTYCIYIKMMLEWLIKRWHEEREGK